MAHHTSNDEAQAKVREIIESTRIAMLTHVDAGGRLVAKPMTTQEVEFDGTIRFIAQRASNQVAELQQRPQVNVSYSSDGAWVSVAGTAHVSNDVAKLKELWNTFNDAWLDGGPEDSGTVLIEIDADTAEYWDSPGSGKVAQVVNLVKTVVTGNRVEGDNKIVDL